MSKAKPYGASCVAAGSAVRKQILEALDGSEESEVRSGTIRATAFEPVFTFSVAGRPTCLGPCVALPNDESEPRLSLSGRILRAAHRAPPIDFQCEFAESLISREHA